MGSSGCSSAYIQKTLPGAKGTLKLSSDRQKWDDEWILVILPPPLLLGLILLLVTLLQKSV